MEASEHEHHHTLDETHGADHYYGRHAAEDHQNDEEYGMYHDEHRTLDHHFDDQHDIEPVPFHEHAIHRSTLARYHEDDRFLQ